MMRAGWMRRWARRVATRRISWSDQRTRPGGAGGAWAAVLGGAAGWAAGGSPGATSGRGRAGPGELGQRFWGWRLVGMLADHGQHGEGQHHQRDVPVPAVPAAGLVVVEPELALGGLEAVLDRPAVSLDLDQGLDPGPGRAPGREEGELAVGDGAPDQQAPRPRAGAAAAVLGGREVGQLEIGPVVQPRPFGPLAGRKPRPRRCGQRPGDLLRRAGHRRLAAPGAEGARAVDAEHVALAGPAQRRLDLAYAADA